VAKASDEMMIDGVQEELSKAMADNVRDVASVKYLGALLVSLVEKGLFHAFLYLISFPYSAGITMYPFSHKDRSPLILKH